MLKQIFVVMMMLVSFSGVYALDAAYYQKLQHKSDSYNQNVDKLPGIIKFLFGNEKINIELTACQSACDIGLQTSDGRIISLSQNPIPNPTVKAQMKESTLKTLLDSTDSRTDFANALKSGEIDFQGVGLIKKIKLGVIKQILKFVL